MRYTIYYHGTAVADFEAPDGDPMLCALVRRLPGFRLMRGIVGPWPQPPAGLLEGDADPGRVRAWVERVIGPRRDLARALELRTDQGTRIATTFVWLSALEFLPGCRPAIMVNAFLDDAGALVPARLPRGERADGAVSDGGLTSVAADGHP